VARRATPSALPRSGARAPAEWRAIDFITTCTCSRASRAASRPAPRTCCHTPADAVFILGDLFEAWVGDDARHDRFEARGAEVLSDAAAGAASPSWSATATSWSAAACCASAA
jgi:UDP-2,3-diacylglucosamine hydrolase